jgi:hypothetical protein
MYTNPNTSEHIYSSYEVGQLINKTPAQISRLINKGYLQGTLTKSGYVFSDQQLGNYYLYQPRKAGRKRKRFRDTRVLINENLRGINRTERNL